jgi:hypothetical protein
MAMRPQLGGKPWDAIPQKPKRKKRRKPSGRKGRDGPQRYAEALRKHKTIVVIGLNREFAFRECLREVP